MPRLSAVAIALFAWLAATPAIAGEDILYQPAPDWILKADMPDGRPGRDGSLLIYDEQFRIEASRLWEYRDIAVWIGSPQELTQTGTITTTWLPDKGDLMIHEIGILRGDVAIDVIAGGARLEILRREQDLEQRSLNGMLTATLPVPGLQVGDVLRLRFSTTLSDQALGEEVQKYSFLPRKPDFRAGFARVRASWPEDAGIRWRPTRGVELGEPSTSDGYHWLEVSLPLDEAEDIPFDAPQRYHMPALLQVGTFSNWQEVSSIMAPYYEWKGAIPAGSDLAARVAGLGGAGELERAVAALAMVQDDIGYLANGLDGGNYIPQAPADTWSLRYGDCKAKTLLLLAILGELGIDAEAVMVSVNIGDALPDLLPMASGFDHVIVRAVIDGNSYWLDGTGTGANLKSIGNVPPFRYGLPIRTAGAELEPIEQVLPRVAEELFEIDFDQTAGAGIPVLFDATVRLYGSAASMLSAAKDIASEDQLFEAMQGIMYDSIGYNQVTEFEIGESEDRSELTLAVRGLVQSTLEFEGSRGEQYFNLPGNGIAFAPDRARRSWRDIPVRIEGPSASDVTLRYRLPNGGKGFELRGPRELDLQIAGAHQRRNAGIDGGVLTISEHIEFTGGEIAPEDVADARRQAAGIERNRLVLVAPADTPRPWKFAGGADRQALEGIEEAYARLIEREPDEVEHLVNRAWFRTETYDFEGALEDYTTAIDLEADAELYWWRSGVHWQLRDTAKAAEDAEEAWNLDPNPTRAMWLAQVMADGGDVDQAMAILEYEDGDEQTRRWLELARADLDGMAGRPQSGFERIEQLLADRPDDPELLNAKCWHMGVWQYALEDSVQVCTRAVEVAVSPAAVLDSRALAYLRTGDLERALSDANAALTAEPGSHATLLLRGMIRLKGGDGGGEEDVRRALARAPALASEYSRYGFEFGEL